ncbi:MAG: polyribonucleotide nucleotidyltransferase [bacterium]
MNEIKNYTLEVGDKNFFFEIGKIANQTNGSVVCRLGDTVVLATVVMSRDETSANYFPLMVDYEEKLYAAGKIKGSRFIKREGRPSDEAVLTARMIDRALRPLFAQHITRDLQVIVTVLSFDGENDSDVPGFLAAALACQISDVPFNGPLGAVRLGRKDGTMIFCPNFSDRTEGDLDLVLAGTKDKVIMVEAAAKEVSEEGMFEAFDYSKKYLGEMCDFFDKVTKEIGKEKMDVPAPAKDEKVCNIVSELAGKKIEEVLFGETKLKRKDLVYDLNNEVAKTVKEKFPEDESKAVLAKQYLLEMVEQMISDKILNEGKRIGGRAMDEIRPLTAEVGILPRTHGTGYFMRGETQVLTVTTLGSPGDEQIIDEMEEEYKKRYMHHYNFPPYSVADVKPMRGPSRRDIGHGSLAEKALESLIPPKEKFPYTIRLVTEVMGSNGSSSMAAVCGSSLSLMDAGVNIPKHVAGVAMGLVSNAEGKYQILTDLQDLEDNEGGMDFKIAGTKDGITAIQLDTKTSGLTDEIVKQTFADAKAGRMKILAVMEKAIAKPRKDLSEFAPRIVSLTINPDKIRDVIGPGGKKINEIIAETGVDIDIEDSGLVMITGTHEADVPKAVEIVKNLTREIEAGEIFTGKVTRIFDFGAMVEILPEVEGLVHISEMAHKRINKVEDEVQVGDEITVKVIEIDSQKRINLSRRAMLPRPERNSAPRERNDSFNKNQDKRDNNKRDFPKRDKKKFFSPRNKK